MTHEYIESFEMAEVVTLTAIEDDSSCCDPEPGICYVVDPEHDHASVTIEDNDVPELYAVSYGSANYITTDPVYVGGAFTGWDTNTLIDEDHCEEKGTQPILFGTRFAHPCTPHARGIALFS